MRTARLDRAGFSLVEVMTASSLLLLLMTGVLTVYVYVAVNSAAGSSQARFVAQARGAEQKLLHIIQAGCGVGIPGGVEGDRVAIYTTNSTLAYLSYHATNRTIEYDTNGDGVGDEIICRWVSALAADGQVFRIDSSLSPVWVQVRFHVGDDLSLANDNAAGTGPGYQGVEVRFSAAPRNRDRVFYAD